MRTRHCHGTPYSKDGSLDRAQAKQWICDQTYAVPIVAFRT